MGKNLVFAAAFAAVTGFVLPATAGDTPKTFSPDSAITKWVFRLAEKDFKELTGKELPADAKDNAEKCFEAFKKNKVAHEGGGAPKGAIVFLKDRLVVSNGNGTALGANPDGSGKVDPAISLGKLGDPLGWAEDKVGGGGGGGSEPERKVESAEGSGNASGGGGGVAVNTGGGGGGGPQPGPVTTDGKLPAWLKPIVLRALKADGLPEAWADSNGLYQVLNAESSFSPTAQNPTSTAYGLFQFLDSTWSTVGATKTSDAYLQCVAGLKYIRERYGDPDKAWTFHLAHGWY
ncbi:MAG TPA: transglycosylase SLT domain-containing protein [Planctomycetota bacterium]|nr:transglycosylase SLT domain-containing protein [Planctomycetota bacterium]